LTSCPVVLLTEQEALTENGTRSGTAEANPLAKKFADQLTARFADLAKVKPVYRELENLYRAVAVTDLLQREAEKAGMIEILADSLGHLEVPKQKPTTELPGKYEVKKVQGQIPGGRMVKKLKRPFGSRKLEDRNQDHDGNSADSWQRRRLPEPAPADLGTLEAETSRKGGTTLDKSIRLGVAGTKNGRNYAACR
jgi:hypothetical protein